MLYIESLNSSLHDILKKNKDVIFIGEDILDPYGGAFKVSKGLSTAFSEQIISTPISEAGIVGAAIGMAMRGLKPIVEIMFGDFIALAADQIINHASKYNWMYNEKVSVPLLIRTPVGGRRGYGPTHSQSLENIFMSVPGLEIVAPSIFHNPGQMIKNIIKHIKKPTIFVEYKMDYSKNLYSNTFRNFSIKREEYKHYNQNLTLSLYPEEKPDIIIITYGGNVSVALEAAEKYFMDEEIIVNVCVLSSLKPVDVGFVTKSIKDCGKVIILEEGNVVGGWGAEVSSIIHENSFDELIYPVQRLGSMDIPIPSSGPMELEMLPSSNDLCKIFNRMK
jgi:pyruvate/2-oxoglutarate/acetoin dehydrogenase E1 component